MHSDTIFALASGRPPAAIAVIRVSGPKAHDAGERIAGALPPAREVFLRELRDPRDDSLLDHALVLRFDAPAARPAKISWNFNAMADGRWWMHCSAPWHTRRPEARRPGEFTRRAFDNGRIDLTEAEGLADLLEAETEAQRRAALAMAEGGLKRQIEQWQRAARRAVGARRSGDRLCR